jgi:hypothetical protein
MSVHNQLQPVWLAPGASTTWWINFNDNRGAQILEADAKTPGSVMWAIKQGLRLETNGTVTYAVVLQNGGPNWCYHNLMGGGLV